MQVHEMPIYQFLEGSNKSFVIPVYQRDYSWTRINCQKLWEDLVDLNKNTRNDHFLGTLVTIGSGFDEYTVIDGQQRLTTVSILLIALHNHIKNNIENDVTNKILQQQLMDFLINKYSGDEKKRIRLKPNKQDKQDFEILFTSSSELNLDSNIINNYQYFLSKISEGKLTPNQIFNSFKKLKIVLINLVRGQDDPQLIFESLNSTGVDLTAGDLIRNYILMDLEYFEQEKLYKNYWVEIEKLTGDIAEFIRNYLTYKLKLSIKKDDVYQIFKVFSFKEFPDNKKSTLEDLLKFANIYCFLIQVKDHPNKEINIRLNRLKKLEFTVCYPYLIDFFNDLNLGILKENEIEEILKIIESYAFRKMLVDNTTQGLNKLFVTISKEIKKEPAWKENYLNILNYILLEKRASQRFPNDDEFENSLINKEIYRLQSKNRNFLLESIENYKSAYKINLDELTVEHIMPQKLTKDWKKMLGENWQEMHNKYLHTLGNLSLTAKNTELSNNTLEDKQRIDYQTSKLKLNFKVKNSTPWTEQIIIDRAKDLSKNAKEIWPFPKTNYSKPVPDEQIFDLSSEDSFTGEKPFKLYLEGNEKGIELKTWRDLLTNTSSFLYNFSPTQFKEIQKNPEFKWYFDKNKPLRHPLEFRKDEFIEGNLSANGIIECLCEFCKYLNYPAEKIQFSINNISEESEENITDLEGFKVGSKVQWTKNEKVSFGEVTKLDPKRNRVWVKYDDDEEGWERINNEKFKLKTDTL